MDEFVTNAAWVRTSARTDTIDDIADQFERRPVPVASLPMRPAAREAGPRWPHSSHGWRSLGRLHPRPEEHRVGPR